MSPINTKTPSPSLAHCRAKGLRFPSSPSPFSTQITQSDFFILPRRRKILQRPKLSSRIQTRTVSSKRSTSPSSTASLASSISSVNQTLKVRVRSLPLDSTAYRRFTPKNPARWLELSPRRYAVCPPPSSRPQHPAHEPRYQPSRASCSIAQLP
jgi:hypothetical protein